MKFIFVFLIVVCCLVFIDKGLTFYNIKQVQKNFPNSEAAKNFNIEKNPIAKWFFQKLGLMGGTVVYFFLSVLTLFIAFTFLSMIFKDAVALYIIILLYALVIGNNFFFALKYSGVIA